MNEAETKIVKQYIEMMEDDRCAWLNASVGALAVIKDSHEYAAFRALVEDKPDAEVCAYKLSPEEERRLAESSAFPPGFKQQTRGINMFKSKKDLEKEIEELEYKFSMALAREGQLKLRLFDRPEELREIKRMSLWDRIFNWPYKE